MIRIKPKIIKITQNVNEAELITHNGTFHSDEVFSTAVLKNIVQNDEVVICRTNVVPQNQNTNAIIYDIGKGKYDHHQIGGNGQRDNGIKYSSFGLIWRNFGKEFLQKFNVENVDDVWSVIDNRLVQLIDAVDNGQLKKIVQYDFEVLTIPNLISLFNSKWDEDDNQDENFKEAVDFAEELLIKLVIDTNSKQKAKAHIEKAIEDSNNNIMILNKFMPWKEFLILSDNPKASSILFVVFPSNREGYSVYTVPKEVGSFESRKLLPESWAGLSEKELQEETGVETAFFCHNGRFICSARTKEDALKLATLALENVTTQTLNNSSPENE